MKQNKYMVKRLEEIDKKSQAKKLTILNMKDIGVFHRRSSVKTSGKL
jgi:hypothetical protein